MRIGQLMMEATVSIWPARPLSEVPEVPLERWRIMQTASGELHLVGARPERGTHRVSSQVIEIDLVGRTATTRSGRRYFLEGDPGSDADEECHHVWLAWCHANRVIEFHDVTNDLLSGTDVNNQCPCSPIIESSLGGGELNGD